MIPKIIHQIYWNRLYENKFHKKVELVREKMILMNPEYQFKIYSEKDIEMIIYNNFNVKIIKAYEKINLMVPKSDLARLLILYLYGGIYLDMKSIIDCKLDDFITNKDTIIVSIDREGWAENFCQWCIISQKKHPLLEIAINSTVYNILNIKYYNDIENMCTREFGRSVIKFHKKYFNQNLTIHINENKKKIKNREKIYLNDKIYYRIFGIEYNNKIFYNKYGLNKYLYKPNNIHWRIEQRKKNVLKGFPILNYLRFIYINPKNAISEPPLTIFVIVFLFIFKKYKTLSRVFEISAKRIIGLNYQEKGKMIETFKKLG